MSTLFKKKKKWRVGIGYTKRTIWVEVFTDVGSQLANFVIERAFERFQATVISQYMDRRYPFFDNEYSRFVDELSQEGTIQVSKVADYTEFKKPLELADTYVLNVFGKLRSDQLDKILHHGVLNISNVIYGVENHPENWQEELLQLNLKILSWFKLRLNTDSDEFVELVHQVGLLEIAIDSNLYFCTTRVEYLTKLLHTIKNLSDQNAYSLILDLERMGNRTKLEI